MIANVEVYRRVSLYDKYVKSWEFKKMVIILFVRINLD